MKVKPAARISLRTERFIEFVVREVFLFIKQTFPSPELINSAIAGLNGGKKLSGRSALSRIQTCFQEFCEKSRQPVKIKMTNLFGASWQEQIGLEISKSIKTRALRSPNAMKAPTRGSMSRR